MIEPDPEICECGDRRSDHPDDGPCLFNTIGASQDLTHGFKNCVKYRPTKVGTVIAKAGATE